MRKWMGIQHLKNSDTEGTDENCRLFLREIIYDFIGEKIQQS